MQEKYLEYKQEKLRFLVEKFGTVAWASKDDQRLCRPYQKLVDIFGNKLDSEEKSGLVEIMCRNTGYSDDFNYHGKEPPISIGSSGGSSVIISPSNPDNGMIYHEAVHFLANYGKEKNRIIKRDIPLAKIIGTFVRLQENPDEEFKFLTGEYPSPEFIRQIKKVATNPFRFTFLEHSQEESVEAGLFAIAAYSLAQEKGMEVGFQYILQKYREYN